MEITEKGLVLNGSLFPEKLIGGNRHQDFARLGNAVPNNLQWQDAVKLRKAGMRVIRSAHYPQDPAFMDACDRLGLFVIVATPGWQFWGSGPFADRVYDDIRQMVRRDRNHPSVMMWEPILNETHYPADFAKKARDLNVPGRDANGVHFAVDYLTSVTKSLLDSQFADGRAIHAAGKNVLVIGGGDTGNDCQGTALRQGCTDLVALEMMPQPPKERAASNPWPEWPKVLKVDYGQTECLAKFGKDPRVYQTTVKEFLTDDAGNLTGAVISYLKPERDPETGRTTMVPTGEEFTYDCQLAFIAAGFVGCENYVADAFGVSLTGRGCVDTDHFRTSVEKVFACGDMRRGQSLVVWGLREGRDCAAEVDRYLMGYTNL